MLAKFKKVLKYGNSGSDFIAHRMKQFRVIVEKSESSRNLNSMVEFHEM